MCNMIYFALLQYDLFWLFAIRRIYWTDARLDSISSADWNGHDRKVILSGQSQVPHPYGIGIYKHR